GERVRYFTAVEPPLSGQHLEEHTAEGPDIAALVSLLAARLLGAHVRGRSEYHTETCERRARDRRQVLRRRGVVRERFREAKVQHLHGAVRADLDVRRLEMRCTIPRSCAASRASAICVAIGSASSSGMGP